MFALIRANFWIKPDRTLAFTNFLPSSHYLLFPPVSLIFSHVLSFSCIFYRFVSFSRFRFFSLMFVSFSDVVSRFLTLFYGFLSFSLVSLCRFPCFSRVCYCFLSLTLAHYVLFIPFLIIYCFLLFLSYFLIFSRFLAFSIALFRSLVSLLFSHVCLIFWRFVSLSYVF